MLMLSKNDSNKKCAPKFIFLIKEEIQKDSEDFSGRKLTLKSDFGTF